jgi:hypothetical protein
LSLFEQHQLMEENMMLIVSFEKYAKAAAESAKPSSENRHTMANSGEMMRGAAGSPLRNQDVGNEAVTASESRVIPRAMIAGSRIDPSCVVVVPTLHQRGPLLCDFLHIG